MFVCSTTDDDISIEKLFLNFLNLLTQDIIWTSIQRCLNIYGRQMDVETTLCAYWAIKYTYTGEILFQYIF